MRIRYLVFKTKLSCRVRTEGLISELRELEIPKPSKPLKTIRDLTLVNSHLNFPRFQGPVNKSKTRISYSELGTFHQRLKLRKRIPTSLRESLQMR